MKDKYAVIAAHREQYPVPLMCGALGVSSSGFYAAQRRPTSARAQADEQLRVEVRAAHSKSRRRYGAPRVHQELRAQGTRIAKKRVARLMREDGLVARRARRFVRTTDSAHPHPVAPNTLARRFAVAEIDGVDRVWTSDITYIPTREGWLYLAAVLDLGSRRVVGWAMGDSLEERLVLDALRMALAQRRPRPGLLAHSDRGSQGGFTRSSQHLTRRCGDGDEASEIGSCRSGEARLSGAARHRAPRRTAGILESHRARGDERGGRH